MPTRESLQSRRKNETYNLEHWNQQWAVTIGYYPDGTVGEVFINSVKRAGTELDSCARDTAILFSVARQYGAPIEVIRHALTRDGNGKPNTIIGAILDQEEKQK